MDSIKIPSQFFLGEKEGEESYKIKYIFSACSPKYIARQAQSIVFPGNVANYTGDIEGGANKGGTQIWKFSIQGNNTWYKVLTNMHDMSFEFWTVVGDAASRDQASYSCNLTSPAYGVSSINQNYYHNGGWNTGSFNYRFVNTPGNSSQYDLECQFSSYYSSSNVGTGYIYLRRVY